MMNDPNQIDQTELFDALAKKIGRLTIDYEVLSRVANQQAEKIKELEQALSKVAESLSGNGN